MGALFSGASSVALRSVAGALRSGRLGPFVSRLTLMRTCPCPETVADEIAGLSRDGLAPAHLALLLDASAEALEAKMSAASPIELVWTGPEDGHAQSRDTSVVARELFEMASRSVVVSTYIVDHTAALFEPLAKRMEQVPELLVRLFVDVKRERRDTRHESETVREFSEDFRKKWPGSRLPEVFYDPRALALKSEDRATLHAKCIVVDDRLAFVTSANFTERAHQRNVEAGVLVRDDRFGSQLRAQFDVLVLECCVHRLPGF